VRLWSLAILLATVMAIAWLAFTAQGLNDYQGRPLGTDFSCLYTAGDMVRHGQALAAYDFARHNQALHAIFGLSAPIYGWFYPPPYLFVGAALASLPYIPALIVWLGATFLAYLVALRALLHASPAPELGRDRLWLLLAVAFPAVFVNLTHGQNGFITAAIIAGGLVLLKPRPLLAGLVFGLLAYKPQFVMALPFALAAGRQWKTLAAMAGMILILCAMATLSFGFAIWPAFFASMQLSRELVVEQGSIGFEKIQSVFGAVRLLGGPIFAAYGVQALVTVGALTALVMIWRSAASSALKGAALCLATTLSTPYCLDYDLVLLAPIILLLSAEGRLRGFRSGEHLVLAALWLMPFAVRSFAGATHIALAPLVLLVALSFVLRRARLSF
jgi:hypothetical protein